jgi:hypothetical protein
MKERRKKRREERKRKERMEGRERGKKKETGKEKEGREKKEGDKERKGREERKEGRKSMVASFLGLKLSEGIYIQRFLSLFISCGIMQMWPFNI